MDGIVSPTFCHCKQPGTMFLREFSRRFTHEYAHSCSKRVYRACILFMFQSQFFRRLFYVTSPGCLLPVHSIWQASSLCTKLFQHPKKSHVKVVGVVSETKINGTIRVDSPNEHASLCSDTLQPSTPLSISLPSHPLIGKEMVDNARVLHREFSQQFSTPEQVDLYREIMLDGAGSGKYAEQESDAYGYLLQVFPEFAFEDGVGCTSKMRTVVPFVTPAQSIEALEKIPHKKLRSQDYPKPKRNSQSQGSNT